MVCIGAEVKQVRVRFRELWAREGLHSGSGLCLEGYGGHWQGDAQGCVLL